MTYRRIDWSTLPPGARVVPVVLVAGIPRVYLPSGVVVTTAAVTSGTMDPLFWPGSGSLTESLPGGSFDPQRYLLDAAQVLEIYELARPLDGDVRQEAVTVSLYDLDGQATADLSVASARLGQLLSADISAVATTIPIASTTGVPTSGIACIGRETIVYDGVGGGALAITAPPAGRGKYGSLARPHLSPESNPPIVSFAGARYWQGRLATVWLCTLSGTTISDPTLVFLGSVSAGVQTTERGLRWAVPIDPGPETLTQKFNRRQVTLYGVAHYDNATDWTPLRAETGAGADLYLSADDTAIDRGGWHPTFAAFATDWQANADAVTGNAVTLSVGERAKITFRGSHGTSFDVFALWDTPNAVSQVGSAPLAWQSSLKVPECFFHLWGRLRVPSAGDFAKIPTTLSYSVTTPSIGNAAICLVADTDKVKGFFAQITERDSGAQEVVLIPAGRLVGQASTGAIFYEATPDLARITKRVTATVGVIARGDTCTGALRAAALAVDALDGTDYAEQSVDWDSIQQTLNTIPLGALPEAREYRFAGEDTLLSVLSDEARLRGMTLAVRWGRLAFVRYADFASTELTGATVTEEDVVREESQEAEWSVIDQLVPLASSVRFTLSDGSTYGYTDSTYRDEFGDGAEVRCGALRWITSGVSIDAVSRDLATVAAQLLGPLAQPQRTVRLPLTGPHFGLQPGDLVSLTHSRVPNWYGSRGVTDAVCQVVSVRRQIFGGVYRAVVDLRLQSFDYAGYAPEALVASLGLDSASPVVQLDTTSAFGPSCFASAVDVNGALQTKPSDGFAVGDKVVLAEIDSSSPIADEAFTIVAVSDTTITLNGNPSSAMASKASNALKVVVRFDDYTTVVTAQKAFAFVADAATGELSGGVSGDRWAS